MWVKESSQSLSVWFGCSFRPTRHHAALDYRLCRSAADSHAMLPSQRSSGLVEAIQKNHPDLNFVAFMLRDKGDMRVFWTVKQGRMPKPSQQITSQHHYRNKFSTTDWNPCSLLLCFIINCLPQKIPRCVRPYLSTGEVLGCNGTSAKVAAEVRVTRRWREV